MSKGFGVGKMGFRDAFVSEGGLSGPWVWVVGIRFRALRV